MTITRFIGFDKGYFQYFFKKFRNYGAFSRDNFSFPHLSGKHTVYFSGKIRYNVENEIICAAHSDYEVLTYDRTFSHPEFFYHRSH